MTPFEPRLATGRCRPCGSSWPITVASSTDLSPSARRSRPGSTHTLIDRRLRHGEWVRVRPGVYADASQWAELDPWVGRPALRAHAVQLTIGVEHWFSHDSAAALHGMGLLRPGERSRSTSPGLDCAGGGREQESSTTAPRCAASDLTEIDGIAGAGAGAHRPRRGARARPRRRSRRVRPRPARGRGARRTVGDGTPDGRMALLRNGQAGGRACRRRRGERRRVRHARPRARTRHRRSRDPVRADRWRPNRVVRPPGRSARRSSSTAG